MSIHLSTTHCFSILLVFSIVLGVAGCSPRKPSYPSAEKRQVIDTYHGQKVPDDYRWLEDPLDSTVIAWTRAQNELTRSLLDQSPSRTALRTRLRELYEGSAITYQRVVLRGSFFALKTQPPRQQPFLVSFDSPTDLSRERVIVDPNEIDHQGGTTIDFFAPSRDGELVAVSMSRDGSENGTLSIYETSTGMKLRDEIPRVNFATASGSAVWNADGSGIYYTRYPSEGERADDDLHFYQQVYFHRIGTAPSNDTYVIGKDFPNIAEIALQMSDDGRHLLASVAIGDGGDFLLYLRGPSGTWTELADAEDGITRACFSNDGKLYLISKNGAPHGCVLSVSLSSPSLGRADTVVRESNASIEQILATPGYLYLLDVIGERNQIRVYDRRTKEFMNLLPSPPLATLDGLSRAEGDQVLYGTETYFEPLAYYRYDPAANGTTRTHLADRTRIRFEECEAVSETARSNDGTEIPMTVLRKKGTPLDGTAPVVLYGYGGFGISLTPDFAVRRKVWLDNGGVYVIAHIRGGGEFGENWHREGMLLKKQNVFDDFIACARRLIDLHYTSPARLAIEGASNGGLLMGAVLTQRPDLFRCVISRVGIYDMLRKERFPNGVFNITEYGTVADAAHFKALYAYSPYHRVTNDVAYPAVLLMTGEHDGRVDPANSRKMAARLQAATSSSYPILLRTDAASGHGIGSSLDEEIAGEVDIFSFLCDQLEVTVK
jgi:prolyl oligopeptidase